MRIFLSLLAIALSLPAAAQWRVSSDQTVGGFGGRMIEMKPGETRDF
jgi:hypothetical protein